MLYSMFIGTTDVNTSTYHVESWSFPDATVRAEAAAADAAGIAYTGKRYESPTWTVTWLVTGTSADTVAAYVGTLTRLLEADATITFNEAGQSQSLWTTIETVTSIEAKHFNTNTVRLTAVGTRSPEWNGAMVYGTASDVNIPGTYTVSASYLDGEVDAGLRVRVLPDQDTTCIWLGGRSDPSASASFVQDYSACADATAFGGEYAYITGSAGYASIGTATSLNAAAMLGRYRVVGRISHSGCVYGNATFRAQSVTTPFIGTATTVSNAAVTSTATGSGEWEVVSLGDVDIPSADLPGGASNFWTTASAFISQATSSGFTSSAEEWAGQTFTLSAASIITSASMYGYADSTTGLGYTRTVYLLTCSGGVPTSDILAETTVTWGSSSGTATATFGGGVELASGVYCVAVRSMIIDGSGNKYTYLGYNSSGGYADGTGYWFGSPGTTRHDMGYDLRFSITGQQLLTQSVSVPIQAANASGGALMLDVATYVPTDEWGIECTHTTSGTLGLYLDATDSDPNKHSLTYASASATGLSLIGASTKTWGLPGAEPGHDHVIVIDAATPASAAPTHAAVTVDVLPRWIHRMGAT